MWRLEAYKAGGGGATIHGHVVRGRGRGPLARQSRMGARRHPARPAPSRINSKTPTSTTSSTTNRGFPTSPFVPVVEAWARTGGGFTRQCWRCWRCPMMSCLLLVQKYTLKNANTSWRPTHGHINNLLRTSTLFNELLDANAIVLTSGVRPVSRRERWRQKCV